MALKLRSLAFALAVFAAASGASPAGAQRGPETAPSPGPSPNPSPDWVTPPSDLPRPERGGRVYNLDTLFEALKVAPDVDSAKAIEDRIWAVWMVSGSDTCNLLMGRAKAAADEKDYDLAVKLLDAVVELRPDYVEGWNRRATMYYLKKDYAHSIADIREVLAREPRHFGALSGLGLILQEIGDDKHALEAYRRVLAIVPHEERIAETVKNLSEKVEGREI